MKLKKFHSVISKTPAQVKKKVKAQMDRMDQLQSDVTRKLMLEKCKEYIDERIEFTHVVTLKSASLIVGNYH